MRICTHLTYLLFIFVTCLATLKVLYDAWNKLEIVTSSSPINTTKQLENSNASQIHLKWFPPRQSATNNLTSVLDGNGAFSFLFNGSHTPSSIPYTTYNWCNMPHVRHEEYVKAPDDYSLEYVEVIHRHHKRTPYASNTFPHETDTWSCDDESLFYYGSPYPEDNAAAISWQVYTSFANPLTPAGFNGSCQFPQITAGGLLDSRQHGKDIFGVYHDLLGFLPDKLDYSKMSFRVTNNQITSQVAGQVILGMYPVANHQRTSVLVQPKSIDSLEPGYSCPNALRLLAKYAVGSRNSRWQEHLQAAQTVELFLKLDAVSQLDRDDFEWHVWFDHYFDNLSSRLCHQKTLPCASHDPTLCITQDDANAVFRRGIYEYSFGYRDTAELFSASVAAYGIWVAELVANFRNIMEGKDNVVYRHNFAHDGSISRLLSILQVDIMFWPGMGSEVVFELYRRGNDWFLRVLWGGQVFTSSNPSLGRIDMLPIDIFLAYIDGLVGPGASKIQQLCFEATGDAGSKKLEN